MNRTEKQTLVDSLHEEFGRSPHAILVDFRGLTVPAVTEFRRKVKAVGSRYRVVKNTLALRAIKDTPLEKLGPKFDDTTGVAYTGQDPVALAKALVDFAKDNPALVVKGGLVAGSQMLDADGVKALSSMPALSELRATLLGVLAGPATKLVRLLNTPASQLVRVLKAHEERQGGAQP
jgi:large subunit ribosomal protein L10